MKLLSSILLLIIFTSCNRHVNKSTSNSLFKKDSSSYTVDTTTKTTITTSKKTTFYGDVLKGSIYLPGSNYTHNPEAKMDTGARYVAPVEVEDSIESGGIKVKAKLRKLPGGGHMLDLEAIAKPKEVQEETATNTTEKKGQSSGVTSSTSEAKTDSKKEVETSSSIPKIIALLALLGVLILIIILVFRKKITFNG